MYKVDLCTAWHSVVSIIRVVQFYHTSVKHAFLLYKTVYKNLFVFPQKMVSRSSNIAEYLKK
jgi:hypothetical protein